MKKIYTLFFISSFIIGYSQTQISQDIDGVAEMDSSGASISISADGTIVAIGSPFNSDNGISSGHVRVFENINNVWTQLGNTIVGEAEFDQSGISLSLSTNGDIIAIGANLNDGNGSLSGHVRVYEIQGGFWTQIGQDIDGEAVDDQSGVSVSLSDDGSIVAIGAMFNDGNGPTSGHVRIYKNQNSNWVQIGDDINGDISGRRLGRRVSLSANGIIVAVNLIGDNGQFDIVRVYENINGDWIQIGDDINAEPVGATDASNANVRLSSNGNIVAFSALGFNSAGDPNLPVSPVTKIYENNNGSWVQIGSTIIAEDPFDGLGTSGLDLSDDGTIVVIGYGANDGNGENSGHVRIYENQNGNWTQLGTDIDGEAAGDVSGASVSLSGDNTTLAIGAFGNDDNGDFSGHTRVYNISSLLSLNNQDISNFNIYPNPTKTQFTIQLQNPTELQNVNIYSKLGQLVFTTKEIIIDSSKFSSGLYTVEVKTTKGKGIKKLIIE